jgi:hypothetical protein
MRIRSWTFNVTNRLPALLKHAPANQLRRQHDTRRTDTFGTGVVPQHILRKAAARPKPLGFHSLSCCIVFVAEDQHKGM